MNRKLHLWDFSWTFHGDSIFHRLGRYWIYGVISGFLKIFEEIFPLIIQRYGTSPLLGSIKSLNGPFSTAMLVPESISWTYTNLYWFRLKYWIYMFLFGDLPSAVFKHGYCSWKILPNIGTYPSLNLKPTHL